VVWRIEGHDRNGHCRLSRFPYGLIHTVENGDILVLAVAHLHSRLDYWRDRLKRDTPSPPIHNWKSRTGLRISNRVSAEEIWILKIRDRRLTAAIRALVSEQRDFSVADTDELAPNRRKRRAFS
jgi:hypothetical protein